MTRSATPIAIAVVRRGDQFLVGTRPAGSPLAGQAEFPGGKIRPGELAADAALRECLEETSIPIVVDFEYPATVQQYDHDRVALHFFACHPVDSQAEPTGGFQWVDRQRLRELDWPLGNRELLRLLLEE